jgi:hypothetical protein
VEFKVPYYLAMSEKAPGLARELSKAGLLEQHLQQKSEEAHELLRQLLANVPKDDLNGRRMAEEVVLATLLDFPVPEREQNLETPEPPHDLRVPTQPQGPNQSPYSPCARSAAPTPGIPPQTGLEAIRALARPAAPEGGTPSRPLTPEQAAIAEEEEMERAERDGLVPLLDEQGRWVGYRRPEAPAAAEHPPEAPRAAAPEDTPEQTAFQAEQPAVSSAALSPPASATGTERRGRARRWLIAGIILLGISALVYTCNDRNARERAHREQPLMEQRRQEIAAFLTPEVARATIEHRLALRIARDGPTLVVNGEDVLHTVSVFPLNVPWVVSCDQVGLSLQLGNTSSDADSVDAAFISIIPPGTTELLSAEKCREIAPIVGKIMSAITYVPSGLR